jgi:hypothetical protein
MAIGITGTTVAASYAVLWVRQSRGQSLPMCPSWLADYAGPTEIVETLDNPQSVESWTKDGLKLADGRSVSLAGVASLPATSPMLAELVKRGVEVDIQSGRVFGLLPIWHWCGNDPVRKHVARVDIAQMLRFIDANKSTKGEWLGSDQLTDRGWNVSSYYAYERWLHSTEISAK